MKSAALISFCAVVKADFSPHSHRYEIGLPVDAPELENQHSDFVASHGVVGLAVNGIPFVYQHVHEGKVRLGQRQFDNCGGHGDDEHHYHYHFAPTCLLKSLGSPVPETSTWWHGNSTAQWWPNHGHSVRVGTALDGAAIYGPYDPVNGALLLGTSLQPSGPLDECHGMHLDDGNYAYFLTASAPFVPPCLRGRPGELTGFEHPGMPCEDALSHQPGCPDHPWFQGTTSDELVHSRHLAATTHMGFLADLLCWKNGHSAITKVNLSTCPWHHTKACLEMPVCIESGFALLTEKACSGGIFEKYAVLDAAGMDMAVAMLAGSNQVDNYWVKVEGALSCGTIQVDAIEMTTCGAPDWAGKCGTACQPVGTKSGCGACGACGATGGCSACGACGAKAGCGACGAKAGCGACGAKAGCGACGAKSALRKPAGTSTEMNEMTEASSAPSSKMRCIGIAIAVLTSVHVA